MGAGGESAGLNYLNKIQETPGELNYGEDGMRQSVKDQHNQ